MQSARRGVAAMIRAAREQPRATALAMAAGLLNGVSMVLGAQALGWATDHFVVPSSDSGSFAGRAAVGTTLLVLGVCALRVTTITLRGVGTGAIQFAAQASSRRRLAARVLDADPAWLRRRPPGRLIATSLSDVDVAWLPMTWFPFAVGMVVMLLIALAAVVAADPVLAAVAAVLVPVVLGATLTAQRLVPPRARTAQQARAAVAQSAHEAFGGHEVLRTLGATDAAVERFAAEVEALRAANVRTASVGAAFDPVVELAPTAAVLAVLAVGAERHAAGALSVGVLVQVVYLLLTAAIPLNVIGRFLSVLPASVVGQERIREVLTAPVAPTTTPRDQGIRNRSGGARLQLLGAASPPALAATDLDLAPGRVTGLAGATGSGKTTLLGLAAGLVTPSSGEVRLDGTPLADLAPGETARHVAIVPQQPFLFGVSVRDNVRLGREASDDEVRAALHVAAADFADDLPGGMDTVLGEEGVRLSGGQRQRIAIARAVLGHPRLLLLDDATSALDPAVERVVLARLAEHARATGATVLLTAARSASIELTDDVVHLASGTVVATGRHEDLLAADPAYRSLVEAYEAQEGALR